MHVDTQAGIANKESAAVGHPFELTQVPGLVDKINILTAHRVHEDESAPIWQ